MTAAGKALPRLLLAMQLATATLLGCSPGPPNPTPVTREAPLPTCDAFVPVLTSLGMTRPDIRPAPPTGTAATGIDCRFAVSEHSTTPGIIGAVVIARLPHTDIDEGVTVQRWGQIWVSGRSCGNVQRPAPSGMRGTLCWTPTGEDHGSATLVGFPRNPGIEITVSWRDPDADPTAIQATAEQAADDLARRLVTML